MSALVEGGCPFRGAYGVLRGEDRLRSGGVKGARYASTFPEQGWGKAGPLTPHLAAAGRSSQATYGPRKGTSHVFSSLRRPPQPAFAPCPGS